MLEFDPFYFEDEVRDGYYINGMMKRAWAAQLEVLADFDALCRRYRLRYMADWGTLLGAVRHGGYIPWDDDMDVGMPRADYNKFLEVKEELGYHYHVINYFTQPTHKELFGRLVNHHGICMEKEHLEKYHGFPFVIGIDIFPYDYIYRDENKEERRKVLVDNIFSITDLIKRQNGKTDGLEELIAEVERLSGRRLLGSQDIISELYHYLDEVLSGCPEEEADHIADYQNYRIKKGKYELPKDVFDRLVDMDYESICIPVPANYDEILKLKYHDYMTIVPTWSTHNYPYYEDQMRILKEHKTDYYPVFGIGSTDDEIPERRKEERRENKRDKMVAVFLPTRAKYWDTMQSEWERLSQDPKYDVLVIPIPFYDKTWDGKLDKVYYEKNLFPEEITPIDPDRVNLEKMHPDVIYFQNAQDDYGETFSVHPLFYSDRLRKLTEKLVYIAPLEPDAPLPENEKGIKSMRYYVTVPGVLYADEVYVCSREMREAYIRCLQEFTGITEGWNEKIKIAEAADNKETLLDAYKGIMVDEWQTKIKRSDGSYKKVLLYELSVSSVSSYGEKMIEKLRRIMDVFSENKGELCVIWRMTPDVETVCAHLTISQQEELLEIVERFAAEDIGILDFSENEDYARAIADAYYGDVTSQVRRFIREGKPVMIADPEI